MPKFALGTAEIIVGKGEKFCLPAFSPFPTVFSKGYFLRDVKNWACALEFNILFKKRNVTLIRNSIPLMLCNRISKINLEQEKMSIFDAIGCKILLISSIHKTEGMQSPNHPNVSDICALM